MPPSQCPTDRAGDALSPTCSVRCSARYGSVRFGSVRADSPGSECGSFVRWARVRRAAAAVRALLPRPARAHPTPSPTAGGARIYRAATPPLLRKYFAYISHSAGRDADGDPWRDPAARSSDLWTGRGIQRLPPTYVRVASPARIDFAHDNRSIIFLRSSVVGQSAVGQWREGGPCKSLKPTRLPFRAFCRCAIFCIAVKSTTLARYRRAGGSSRTCGGAAPTDATLTVARRIIKQTDAWRQARALPIVANGPPANQRRAGVLRWKVKRARELQWKRRSGATTPVRDRCVSISPPRKRLHEVGAKTGKKGANAENAPRFGGFEKRTASPCGAIQIAYLWTRRLAPPTGVPDIVRKWRAFRATPYATADRAEKSITPSFSRRRASLPLGGSRGAFELCTTANGARAMPLLRVYPSLDERID
ncbi:unnamed protein product, partial [Iphiclides podalirius]